MLRRPDFLTESLAMSMPLSPRLALLGLLLSLGACQLAPAPADTEAPIRRLLEQQLASGDLPGATDSFHRLQQAQPEAQLERYQRLLADAWLQQGQQALERGDMGAAAKALANARALMPQAPALTNEMGGRLPAQEAGDR